MSGFFESMMDTLDDAGVGAWDVVRVCIAIALTVWATTTLSAGCSDYEALERSVKALAEEMDGYEYPSSGSMPSDSPAVRVTAALDVSGEPELVDPVYGVRAEGAVLKREVMVYQKRREYDRISKKHRTTHRWVRVVSGCDEDKEIQEEARLRGRALDKRANGSRLSEEESKVLAMDAESFRTSIRTRDFRADMKLAGIKVPDALMDQVISKKLKPLENFSWNPDRERLAAVDEAMGYPMEFGFTVEQAPADEQGNQPSMIRVHHPPTGKLAAKVVDALGQSDSPQVGDLKVTFSRVPVDQVRQTHTVCAAIKDGAFAPMSLNVALQKKSLMSKLSDGHGGDWWKIVEGKASAEDCLAPVLNDAKGLRFSEYVFFVLKMVFALGLIFYTVMSLLERKGVLS